MSITGDDDTCGILLYPGDGGIGSAARPVTVSGNLMNVVSTNAFAYGIRVESENSTYLNVTKNVMNVEASFYARSLHTYIGSGSLLLKFAGNDVTIRSSGSAARVLYLDVDNGDFGTANNPIVIKDNRFTLEAAAGLSYLLRMIMIVGNEDVYLRALDNSITFTNTGTGSITAFHFEASVGSPGNIGFYPNYPVIISGNSAKFYGGNNLFINADTINDNNYNYLIWGGNYLYNTGTWAGSYGPNNEVEHTFTGSDVIYP